MTRKFADQTVIFNGASDGIGAGMAKQEGDVAIRFPTTRRKIWLDDGFSLSPGPAMTTAA